MPRLLVECSGSSGHAVCQITPPESGHSSAPPPLGRLRRGWSVACGGRINLHTFITATRYSGPSPVLIRVMSVTHSSFVPAGRHARSTRSIACRPSSCSWRMRRRKRLVRPCRPFSRLSAACLTHSLPTRLPRPLRLRRPPARRHRTRTRRRQPPKAHGEPVQGDRKPPSAALDGHHRSRSHTRAPTSPRVT